MERSGIVCPYLKIIHTQVKKNLVCPNFLPFLEPKSEHFLFHLLDRSFAQLFCLSWSQNRSISITYHRRILPKFLPLLEPKLEHFYITYYVGILPNFFAFFGAKIGAFSITYNRRILPKFFAFFGAKIGALSVSLTT